MPKQITIRNTTYKNLQALEIDRGLGEPVRVYTIEGGATHKDLNEIMQQIQGAQDAGYTIQFEDWLQS